MAFLSGTNLLSLLLLVAAFFFFTAGLRALRLGRKTIYFRHRRQRVLAGWWLTGAALLLGILGVLIFRPGKPLFVPAPLPPTPLTIVTPASATPSRVSTPSPRPSPSARVTASPTTAPQLPMSIDIVAASSVTPLASASIGDLRFSLLLEDVYPVGQRFEFNNPIRRMYASFAYRDMTPGAQLTVLWFRNGELVFFETRAWQAERRGRGSSKWEPAPHEWLPGEYEVQIFVGTTWKATGIFTLTGDPRAPTPTSTPRPTRTPSPTLTMTRTPSNTPIPTQTITPVSTRWTTLTPEWRRLTVYFVDSQRITAGLLPFEVAVTRYAPSSTNPIRAVLDEYFKGPGDTEKRNGLVNYLNGFTGHSQVLGDDGVLRVYLLGRCQASDQSYSIAQALIANLKQFPEVRYVKIYNENIQTQAPTGLSDSAPACLGISSLLNPTVMPTSTPLK